jgi:hypothetical protein
MGILGKLIVSAATQAIVKTVGETVVSTTEGVLKEVHKHDEFKEQHGLSPSDKIIRNVDVDDYIGEHYLEAYAALASYGFTNITYIVKRDLVKGWMYKDGEVENISIGGKSDFDKKTKFKSSNPVVITYHTFKNSPSATSPDTDFIAIGANQSIFCPNCGHKNSTSSNFCMHCGHKL